MSTSPLEIRMAHIEGAFEQINARLGAIEQRLGRLEDRFARFDDKLDARIDSLRSELLIRMDRQFYWMISLVVLAILVPICLRLINP
jgi:hypothetical protein